MESDEQFEHPLPKFQTNQSFSQLNASQPVIAASMSSKKSTEAASKLINQISRLSSSNVNEASYRSQKIPRDFNSSQIDKKESDCSSVTSLLHRGRSQTKMDSQNQNSSLKIKVPQIKTVAKCTTTNQSEESHATQFLKPPSLTLRPASKISQVSHYLSKK